MDDIRAVTVEEFNRFARNNPDKFKPPEDNRNTIQKLNDYFNNIVRNRRWRLGLLIGYNICQDRLEKKDDDFGILCLTNAFAQAIIGVIDEVPKLFSIPIAVCTTPVLEDITYER